MFRSISNSPIRSFISAIVAFSIILAAAPFAGAFAGPDRSKSIRKVHRTSPFKTSVRFGSMSAEKFATGVKISWRTEFEQNIAGFRVWREDGGTRFPVADGFVGGSVARVRAGILPAGEDYVVYDPSGNESSPYWLESVDLNSESRWFGPAFARVSYFDPENETEKLAAIAARAPTVQTEKPAGGPTLGAQPVAIEAAQLAGDASALKIEVRTNGIYQIAAQSLTARGFDRAQAANWKMYKAGVEQPIIVTDDGSIEFYGRGIDTLQTDASVYWLASTTSAGRRINRTNEGFKQSARDSSSCVVAERRERAMRLSGVINGPRDNWFGSYIWNTPIEKSIELRDIATESDQTATIGIDLQGIANLVHKVNVKLNGNSVGQISFNAFNRKEWTAAVPLAWLVEGSNLITLQSVNTTSDYSLSEALRITYPRRLKASGDRLEFVHESNQSVKLRGFTTPAVRIFDVTDPTQVSETIPESQLENDGTYSVTVSGTSSPKTLLAQGVSVQLYSAEPLIPNVPSALRSPSNEGRLIIIAPEPFFKPLYELRDLREMEGMRTKLVDIEDIYDEFSDGVKSADAIRSFLQYAKTNWAQKPDYVILAGDSSCDPRNFSGIAGNLYNRVPTMFTDTWNIEAPSDEMLVDFNDDGIGEIAVGRLPAQTPEEMYDMVVKTVNVSALPAAEAGSRGVHFVSDDFIGYNFAVASRNIASTIPGSVPVNYIDRTNQDPTLLRSDIINRINNNAAIVNFFGHGSVTSWTSGGILRNVDAASLFNPKRNPLIVALACLNGDNTGFGVLGLAESMMKRGQGGAYAVWASTAWNGAYEEELMGKDLYQRIFAGMPLGDAVREVKSLYPTIDMRRTFIFFGDPSQRLIQPQN